VVIHDFNLVNLIGTHLNDIVRMNVIKCAFSADLIRRQLSNQLQLLDSIKEHLEYPLLSLYIIVFVTTEEKI
jgi:hypothetical protein